MIGPVSGTGRAMMSSLQQAIQKGMPPDQAVQYVKSMATQGVAPLADLYAMMNQFQRLKQPQVKPPQTPPTIKDQLNALDQQRQMPQGNIQQMQAPAPAGQPMDRGLGAIDAGLMEYPKFAGGGVVALAGGGDPEDYEEIYGRLKGSKQILGGLLGTGVSAENLSMLRDPNQFSTEEVARLFAIALSKGDLETATPLRYVLRNRGLDDNTLTDIERKTRTGVQAQEDVRAQEAQAEKLNVLRTGQPTVPVAAAPAPVAAPPAPVAERRPAIMGGGAASAPPAREDITDEQYEKLQAFRKREGLGAAREEMRQFLTGEEKRLDKAYGEDRRLAFADIGFKMAAAASRPGATFLGALAEGAMSGTQAMRAMNKELAENKRLLKQSMIKLKEADELEKEGDYKAAMGLNREARAEALKLYELRENLKTDYAKIRATENATAASREYTMASQDENRRLRATENALRYTQADPNYLTKTYKLNALMKDPEENATEIAKLQGEIRDIERKYEVKFGMNPEDVTAASDAVAELQRLASARGLNLVPAR